METTQAARLLAVSLLGQKVNPLRGWINLGIYRHSDTKCRLDVQNWFGETSHVAFYVLPEWPIEKAGERDQAFACREMDLMAQVGPTSGD